MRVVFLGTPDFAVPSLRMLLDHSYEICAVFTQPDRPSGRGQRQQPSPVKVCAQANGIPIFQPERIRNEENRAIFDSLRPDFIAVVAYGQILPGWLLRAARVASVNVHFSLLPLYRGAAPVSRAILNGEKVTGVTTMLLDEKLDAGPILLQQEAAIPLTKTTGELTSDLADIGANLLIQTMDGLQKEIIKPVIQDENRVSWAPRITKEMALIPWNKRALEIHNQIRAMNPWPVAYGIFRHERLQIWRSLPEEQAFESALSPGAFLGQSPNVIRVLCGEGTVLDLVELQMPGKGRVTSREFANGARLRAGEQLFQK